MYNLSEEEFNELTQYVSKMGKVSIPQIQRNFGWNYPKAKRGVDRLVELNKLEYKEGNVFAFINDGDGNYSAESDSGLSEELEREIDEYLDDFEETHECIEELYDIKTEKNVIKTYADIAEALEKRMKEIKKTEVKEDEPIPEDAKPVGNYFSLSRDIKALVDVTIKLSSTKTVAKYALMEGSSRWKRRTYAYYLYRKADRFLDTISNTEYKVIKRYIENR